MPDGSRSIHISESTSRGTNVRFGSNRGHLHIVSPRSPDRGRHRAESRQSIAGPLIFDEGHTAEIRARFVLLAVVGITCCSVVTPADFASTQFMIHKTDRSEFRPHSEPAQTASQRRTSESADISGPWKQPSIVRRTEPSTRDT